MVDWYCHFCGEYVGSGRKLRVIKSHGKILCQKHGQWMLEEEKKPLTKRSDEWLEREIKLLQEVLPSLLKGPSALELLVAPEVTSGHIYNQTVAAKLTQDLHSYESEQQRRATLQHSDQTCPSCGKGISANYKLCPYCGLNLEFHPTCGSCGKELQLGFKVCPYCGVAQGGGGPAPVASKPPVTQARMAEARGPQPQAARPVRKVPCPACKVPLAQDTPRCPACGAGLEWD